jgi:hypothetical protein
MNATNLPVVGDLWSSVAHVSFDMIVILLLFVGFAALSFYFGKSKSIALILASYISLFLWSFSPFLKDSKREVVVTLGGFLIVWFVTYFIIKKNIFAEFPYSLFRKIFESSVLSLSILILIFIASFHLLPIGKLYHFSKAITPLFAPIEYVFYWLCGPLLAIYFISR